MEAFEINGLCPKRAGSSAGSERNRRILRGLVAATPRTRVRKRVAAGIDRSATALCVSGVCHAELRSRKRSNEKGLWRGGRDSNRQYVSVTLRKREDLEPLPGLWLNAGGVV
jgi:hypothetical protein